MSIEIERKFLIKLPDEDLLLKQDGIRVRDITQTYLVPLSEEVSNRRVRKIVEDGKISYTYTEKRRISEISREEYESEIGPDEYSEKLTEAVSFLIKTRFSFPFGGHVIEIDVYPRIFGGKALEDRAVLEVELKNEDEKIILPDFLEVIREVTGMRKYSNMKLARKVRTSSQDR